MAMSSNDFIEARKVSLTALNEDDKTKKRIVYVEAEPEEEEEEQEYFSTGEMLLVRDVAYSTLEDEAKYLGNKKRNSKELEQPVNVHKRLYAETMETKAAVELEERQVEILNYRG